MKIFTITSKTHGKFDILLDDKDHTLITGMGKWNISILRGKPYAQKRIKGKVIQMARFIMDAKPGEYVDHINHSTLDNQRGNLRRTTNAANLRNGTVRVNNKSGYPGVWFDKSRNKWAAYIKVNYKKIHLGRFSDLSDAVNIRAIAERRYFSI
jgi:hypothetical protein